MSDKDDRRERISAALSGDENLGTLIEFLPVGVAIYTLEDPEDLGSFRCRFRNAAAADISRTPNEALLGKPIRESVPELLETDSPRTWELALQHGQVQKLPAFHYGDKTVQESIFDITVVPISADTVAICYDRITDEELEIDTVKQEQARLQYLMSSVPSIIYTAKATADYGITFVSDNLAAVLGHQPDDFIGDASFWSSIVHPEDAPRIFEAMTQVSDSISVEYRLRHLDGSYRWIHDQLKIIKDELQIPIEIVGTWSDITERRRAEYDLQTSHDLLEKSVEERTAELSTANRELQEQMAARQLRETQTQALRRVQDSVWQMLSPDDIQHVLESLRESLSDLGVPYDECGINVVDKTVDPPTVRIHQTTRGGEWYFSSAPSEGAFMTHLWGATGPVYRRDLEVDDPFGEAGLNYAKQQVRSILDIPFASGTIAVNSSVPGAFSRADIAVLEELASILSGGFLRVQDLRQLAAERERLAVTLRSIGDGVISTDSEGNILLMNRVAEELTGWTDQEAIGQPFREIFHTLDSSRLLPAPDPVSRVMDKGMVVGQTTQSVLVSRDGSERKVTHSGAPIRDEESKVVGVVLVFRDITAEEKMEEELLRSEKLESVGLLAGGIAHDFNNLLTGIIGNVALAKMDADPDGSISASLVEAEKACQRAADLTRQLLTFSKGGAPIKRAASIGDLITESATFALRGSNVRSDITIANDLWTADIDEGQISQVIQNLTLNADQAMPDGGILKVAVENAPLRVDTALPLPAGNYVRITVSDSGVGISAEHLVQIFDPYFTTKQSGSGLGLATSYSIVSKHGGHLQVESVLGEGSTFTLYLPASVDPMEARPRLEDNLVKGTGRILIMDDEEPVLSFAERMLDRLGYQANLARDGREAVELYRKALDDEPFAAVVLDLTVPGGMGGRETIEALRDLDPHVKAIVSSGYSNDPIMAQFRQYGFKGVVAKPYDVRTFSQVLNRTITDD